MRKHVLLIGCAFVVVGVAVASAELLYTLESPNPSAGGEFGFSVANAGDVSGDGFDDVIIGAPGERTAYDGAGRAYVYDGATGALLRTLISPDGQAQGRFGCSVAGAGDVDSDGCPDVVVGAEKEDGVSVECGRAYVFSGDDWGLLLTLDSDPAYASHLGCFGYAVSGAGDVNNDSYDDVIVGAPCEPSFFWPPEPGLAYVFSGNGGGRLRLLASPNYLNQEYGHFGLAVSGFGDINNDGYDDVAIGAPGEWIYYLDTPGRAYVVCGQTGVNLYTLISPTISFEGGFGNSVSAAGDVDADGHTDFIVGASAEWIGNVQYAGRAHVMCGQTAEALHTLESPTPTFWGGFGCSVAGAGDVEIDGHDDVIVGAFWEGAGGRSYVFSGGSGALLHSLASPNEETYGNFGRSVCGVCPADGNSPPHAVVGAPLEDANLTNAGRVYAFTWMLLSAVGSGGGVVLQWSAWPTADAYWVYGADNEAYFEPGLILPYQHRLAVLSAGTTTWSSPSGVGDPGHNWTYLVVAVDAGNQELCRSNRVGEQDFDTSN
jgi:hypothetical protein